MKGYPDTCESSRTNWQPQPAIYLLVAIAQISIVMKEEGVGPSRRNASLIHFVHPLISFSFQSYRIELQSRVFLHHDPLCAIVTCHIITFLCRAPASVRCRPRACTRLT
jgi:hypothetical protein